MCDAHLILNPRRDVAADLNLVCVCFQVYNSDREILCLCDSVDTWLESNVPETGKLKIVLTQISEAFSKYRRSLQLDLAAVEVRRQYKMITQNLLSELGHPATKLESENQTGATHAQGEY